MEASVLLEKPITRDFKTPPSTSRVLGLSLYSDRLEVRHRAEAICRKLVFAGDFLAGILGLAAALYVRFTVLGTWGTPALEGAEIIGSKRYIFGVFFGALLLNTLILCFRGYDSAALLRFRRSFPIVVRSWGAWVLTYPAISLFLGMDWKISRLFLLVGAICLCGAIPLGRLLSLRLISAIGITKAFRQRVLFVDWTDRTASVARAIQADTAHPYELVGCAPPPSNRFTKEPAIEIPSVGSYSEITTLCENKLVDIVILADGKRTEQDMLDLADICEKSMVAFMVIPSGFQVLVSGLALTTVSGVPMLGVTKLPLDRPLNAALKRAADIVGSIFGMVVSAPIIAVLALLVYLESPGPIFYRQVRVGRKGRQFKIIKIRSMKLDAEAGGKVGWSTKHDDRRLKVGSFMRRLNLDELPQFWNVLCGDLSMVGPRPERPELIENFRHDVRFYNARHNIVPGMTGWAQVNGLRGDTDLSERIRYDIYYIENWSLVFDIQIMFMTFFRWEGAH
jgi:exopolysaccharide biosynthesis polyprenyl glycosylphosphotransferase